MFLLLTEKSHSLKIVFFSAKTKLYAHLSVETVHFFEDGSDDQKKVWKNIALTMSETKGAPFWLILQVNFLFVV